MIESTNQQNKFVELDDGRRIVSTVSWHFGNTDHSEFRVDSPRANFFIVYLTDL